MGRLHLHFSCTTKDATATAKALPTAGPLCPPELPEQERTALLGVIEEKVMGDPSFSSLLGALALQKRKDCTVRRDQRGSLGGRTQASPHCWA